MNSNNGVIQIPIEDLVPNRFQPRVSFDEKALNDLARSIKQHGIIQPLVVRRLGDKYEIIAGERRYKAAQIAGLISVPGIVTDANDESSAEIALVENVQREDLSSIEEAKSYKNILDKSDMTQEELAKRMGLSQSAVSNKLRLLNLNDDVQEALMQGRISERHARSLLTIDNPDTQSNMLQRVLDERLTVKQLDDEIKKLKNPVRDDVVDDVPLVDNDFNLEAMQQEATDITPPPSYSYNNVEESTSSNDEYRPSGSKFFAFSKPESDYAPTSEETSVEERPNVSSEPTFFEFGKSINSEELTPLVKDTNAVPETPIEMMVEEMLDTNSPDNGEIETLDVEPGVGIFEPHKSSNMSDMLNDIRNYIREINVNHNIKMEEIDTPNSYKITIEIEKDS